MDFHWSQCEKKVVSNSPGLVDFAVGLVIFLLNLPDGQVLFFGKFKLQKDCNQSCLSKRVLGLVEMTCGLVDANYSLPEWQAVKVTFFAPCEAWILCAYGHKTLTDFMCVNELDNVWEVKVMSNSKIWTLTNQLLNLCATLHVCWFFIYLCI